MKFVLIALQIILINEQLVNCYNVALVEYFWDDEIFPKLSPIDLVNRNAKIYNEIVGKIKKTHGKLDIVVFPESTLVSDPKNTPEGRKGMTLVPEAANNVVPCNSTRHHAEFFKLLSCTALEYRTYLVVNLREKTDDNKAYNTDVVFDRSGKIVAKYRKYHLYLEPNTDQPLEPELVTFDTDFGKTFGIFTCFDVIYRSPAIDLVRKGVENFIFPTLWIPELPFHTTIQTQQMWAQGNDVNFLSSCAARPLSGSGGVGIFLGNKGVLGMNISVRTDNYYLYQEVPEKKSFDPCCVLKVNDRIAEEMDKYTLYKENLSDYVFKVLDTGSSKSIEEKLCQRHEKEELCCNFKITTTVAKFKENSSIYTYFLVTRFGTRTYGIGTYKTGAENCGLIACPGNSLKNCGKRFPTYNKVSWPITFEKIEISATFEDSDKKIQFPNSLLADFSPIPPSCTTWKTETNNSTIRRTFSTNVPVTKLLTFAIFGRNFNLDVI